MFGAAGGTSAAPPACLRRRGRQCRIAGFTPQGGPCAAGQGLLLLFLLYGTDRLAVRERRDALLREALPTGDDLALSRLDGQKVSADDLSRAVQALPFFGDCRVVLVDDLLSRFESKRRKAAGPEAAEPEEA